MNAELPVTIGIAGGTGSGKTTVAKAIIASLGMERTSYLAQDAYYHDLRHLPALKRSLVNFDHPDALEMVLMTEHLRQLKSGSKVTIPVYDFECHERKGQTLTIESKPVIIVEGILIYIEQSMRDLLDVKIYVDTDSDIRFIRRLRRDVSERGRTVESVAEQYMETVRPGHIEFVEPTKRFADVIIQEGSDNEVAINMLVSHIETMIRNGS